MYIDLLNQSISPNSSEFKKLLASYHSRLQKQLEKRHIPCTWVTSASIDLDFNPPCPSEKHIPVVTWGNLFKLTVSITDDEKRNHVIEGYSYCGPHNPSTENKSTRA